MIKAVIDGSFAPGVNWLIVYWLVSAGTGIVFCALNVRAAHRQFVLTRAEKRSLATTAMWNLVLQGLVAFGLAGLVVVGVVLAIAAATHGLRLQFADTASEVGVYVVVICILTGPSLYSILNWLQRHRIGRALDENGK